ncbi:MAG: N-acetylornithine carbamoyltransferase [Cytophagales bacterium]|nr:N-acetylornithine carbamoyltransferase [Cytophagales bacterium]
MKQFISTQDIDSVPKLVQIAKYFKASPHGKEHLGKNKTLGLLFFNSSLRTRLSTQKAAQNLGMNVLVMNVDEEGWKIEFDEGAVMNQGEQEHLQEAAAVLSQYCDFIGVRSFASLTDREADYEEKILRGFIRYAKKPVFSMESATRHPLQSLADVLTVEENKTVEKPKVVLSWAPHPLPLPQAVANSFLEWMKQTDCELVVTNPEGFDLSEEFTEGLEIVHDQCEALKNADFVYAKNWSSFENYGATTDAFSDWTIDSRKMALTNRARFMHCLPVRRNVVVTDEVLNSEHSLVIEQANNRTFAAQAVLYKFLQDG